MNDHEDLESKLVRAREIRVVLKARLGRARGRRSPLSSESNIEDADRRLREQVATVVRLEAEFRKQQRERKFGVEVSCSGHDNYSASGWGLREQGDVAAVHEGSAGASSSSHPSRARGSESTSSLSSPDSYIWPNLRPQLNSSSTSHVPALPHATGLPSNVIATAHNSVHLAPCVTGSVASISHNPPYVPQHGGRRVEALSNEILVGSTRRLADWPSPATNGDDHPPSLPHRASSVEQILIGSAVGLFKEHDLVVRGLGSTWLPEPHVGIVEITLRADGRFGLEDHLLFPQVVSSDRPHLALLPKRPAQIHRASVLWDCPSMDDFERVNNHPEGESFGQLRHSVIESLYAAVATLNGPLAEYRAAEQTLLAQRGVDPSGVQRRAAAATRLKELKTLETNMRLTLQLFSAPCTFPSVALQWGHLHRCYAECWAWMDWQMANQPRDGNAWREERRGIANGGVIGGICEDPQTALRMYGAGVPVWLVTPARMSSAWETHPNQVTIYSLMSARMGICLEPSRLGLMVRADVGRAHASALWSLSAGVYDFERLSIHKTLRDMAGSVGAVLDREQQKAVLLIRRKAKEVAGGMERFHEDKHRFLPGRVPVWQEALMQVDFTQPAPDNRYRLGLWLPEAEFVFTPQSPRRLFVYMHNWLRFRPHLLRLLSGISYFTPPRPTAWGALLGRFPAISGNNDETAKKKGKQAHAKRHTEKLQALEFFAILLNEEIAVDTPMPHKVVWKGTTIFRDNFLGEPEAYAAELREMAWELSELAFRVELYEMDRHMTLDATEAGQDEDMVRWTLLAQVVGELEAVEREKIVAGTIIPKVAFAGNTGLRAQEVRARVRSLESLRQLMMRWPNCPQCLKDYTDLSRCPEATIMEFERAATRYYCQKFYEWSARAPVVPRVAPNINGTD